MGVPVLVLGASGTGKTYALRNIPNDKYGLIECEKTMLPFNGGKKFARTKDYSVLRDYIKQYATKYPIVVVDDFGYAATDLYIRHIDDRDQFGVYKSISAEVYHTIEFINELPGEVLVYVTMHTDSDNMGNVVPQIMGKFVNEKMNLLGMLNVVLLADISDGEHVFITDGKPPAKCCGALAGPTIPNDLWDVDKGLREFLGWKPVEAKSAAVK